MNNAVEQQAIQEEVSEQPPDKAPNGTYTQVPNVFFDTCDLPETAQILYLRLFRSVGHYQDCSFTGSIRKLSNLVRLSKSTTDRMIKVLSKSGLIKLEYASGSESDRAVMVVTILRDELWSLNKYHHKSTVPIWDKVMPETPKQIEDCPKLGRGVPEMGRDNFNLGRGVPSRELNLDITSSNTNNKLQKDIAATAPENNISSFLRKQMEKLLTPEEQTWFVNIWCKSSFIGKVPTLTENLANRIQVLAPCISTVEQLNELHTFTKLQLEADPTKENTEVKPGNMTNVLSRFLQEGSQYTLENAPQDEADGVNTGFVIWTRQPDQALSVGVITSKTPASYLALFEEMTETEAMDYGYGGYKMYQDLYYPGLSPDETKLIKNYLATQHRQVVRA